MSIKGEDNSIDTIMGFICALTDKLESGSLESMEVKINKCGDVEGLEVILKKATQPQVQLISDLELEQKRASGQLTQKLEQQLTQRLGQLEQESVESLDPLNLEKSENVNTASKLKETNPDDVLRAPLIGVAYTSSTPNSDPFVRQGDHVKKGEIVCIIEAMKIMNEIEAHKDGIIQKMLFSNGDLVEFSQPLVVIS